MGQENAVATRQYEHQLRLKAAFNVNVQFALGQTSNQGVHPCTSYGEPPVLSALLTTRCG
jgi:hypothetical protein